jgi:perosamine synthetase
MQCALGTSQTARLGSIIEKRLNLAKVYRDAFSEIPNILLPVDSTPYSRNNYWVFGMVLQEGFGVNAKSLMEILDQKGIGTRPFFYPLHKQPVLEKFAHKKTNLPVSERLGEFGFYIPNGLGMKEEQVSRVVDVVSQVLSKNAS